MDFRDTPEEASFRREVRQFLDQNLPKGYGTPDFNERQMEGQLQGEEASFMQRWRQAHGRAPLDRAPLAS